MEYTFSWGSFFIGLIILLVGGALVVWFRPIADNFGGGVSSYERYRMWGLIACGVGFVIMLNLHSVLLTWALGGLFRNGG